MNFKQFKSNFISAINKLNIPQNDKNAIIDILSFINTDNKTETNNSVSINNISNTKIIKWDNDEIFNDTVRVRITALNPNTNINIKDIIIDNNNNKYKVISFEANNKVVLLQSIK